jgi:hypothetical protein
MRKSDFMAVVKKMADPDMWESYDCSWPFSSCYWIIEDRKDPKRRLLTPTVRISTTEYREGVRDAYCIRRDRAEKKYRRWFNEAKELLKAN